MNLPRNNTTFAHILLYIMSEQRLNEVAKVLSAISSNRASGIKKCRQILLKPHPNKEVNMRRRKYVKKHACMVISYLLGIDFLCLTVGNPLYYRTSSNKRRRKELSMNTFEAALDNLHQNLPAAQPVQYELIHTPGFLRHDNKED